MNIYNPRSLHNSLSLSQREREWNGGCELKEIGRERREVVSWRSALSFSLALLSLPLVS